MTLLVLNNTDAGLFLYTDSRISGIRSENVRKITDMFTKGFIVPYHFTVGPINAAKCSKYKGEIGFAFAGNTLAGTAIGLMLGNILCNMHCDDPQSKPTFDTFVKVALRATELFHEETIVNPLPYTAYIFGFCPTTGHSRVARLSMKKVDGINIYQTEDLDLPVGGVTAAGTGRPYFWEVVKRSVKLNRRFGDIVYDAINTSTDAGTGGAVQIIAIDREAGRYWAVMEPADGGGANMFVSGLQTGDLGRPDGFHLGRDVLGVGLDVIKKNNDLKMS